MHTAARPYGLPLAASLGLHGLLLLVAASWLTLAPGLPGSTVSRVSDEEKTETVPEEEEIPLEEVAITFIPSAELEKSLAKPEPEPEPDPARMKPVKPKPPEQIHVVAREDMPALAPLETDTPFISDRNMRASATEAPVSGADPRIGNQSGVDTPGLSLFNANATPGGQPAPPPPPPPQETPPDPVADTPPPPPAPPSSPAPAEDRPPEKATVQTDSPNAPAPPQKKAEMPALREPDLNVKPQLTSRKNASLPRDPVQPPPPKAPAAGQKPVVSSVKTKTEGSLAVRGSEASVDAKDTPEGRFYSAMHESIGLIWNTRLATVHGLTGSGVVEVEFDIDINGRVSGVKLVDPGKANPVLEDVCLTSVIKAKIPPLPASLKRDLEDPLTGGKLHQKVNFYKIPPP